MCAITSLESYRAKMRYNKIIRLDFVYDKFLPIKMKK